MEVPHESEEVLQPKTPITSRNIKNRYVDTPSISDVNFIESTRTEQTIPSQIMIDISHSPYILQMLQNYLLGSSIQ